MVAALHEDEIPIDVELVRGLVDRALPEYAALEVRSLEASGSSNALFRLGPDLLVRLPRQRGGSATIEKEARWLPLIEDGLSVRVPRVLGVCDPDLGYPERWSITQWIEGEVPTVVTGEATTDVPRHALAQDLATVLNQMRQIPVPPRAVDDESLSWYRGSPLADMDADFRESVDECRRLTELDLDLDAVLRVWGEAVAASRQAAPATGWYHGDLLAENLLVSEGRLAAVLDFGGLAVGDPAVDAMAAWEVLDGESRETFRRAIGATDATWLTSMAWALLVGVITFPYYWDTMPARCESRRAMVRAVLGDL